jgi:hypothetical protein
LELQNPKNFCPLRTVEDLVSSICNIVKIFGTYLPNLKMQMFITAINAENNFNLAYEGVKELLRIWSKQQLEE